jgi:radical SAM/Cys-rich protein
MPTNNQGVSSNSLPAAPEFERVLAENHCGPLTRGEITTLQLNLGKLCNQTCSHCHVDAGPDRTETMTDEVAKRVIRLLAASPQVQTVDLTGGAPELNRSFRHLVAGARRLGRHVIDRCNLTVLFEDGMTGLGKFLVDHEVEIIASLPCYTPANLNQQRGPGVFDKSIRALRQLNALGYGLPDSKLALNLVYNPLGAFLPGAQDELEADYKLHLRQNFGVEFHKLFTITNMPIQRFAECLRRSGEHASYMGLLVRSFNPSTVATLMCRSLVSVAWDGRVYDCDFSQMLELGIGGAARTIWEMESFSELAGKRIATGQHCFACTAGNGSSCKGSLQ